MRRPLLGQQAPVCIAVPDRSPGPLGWQDAADPDELMCIMGDTPGPVGSGSDLSCRLMRGPQSPAIEVPVLDVSIGKVERFLYTVARVDVRDLGSIELTRHGGRGDVE